MSVSGVFKFKEKSRRPRRPKPPLTPERERELEEKLPEEIQGKRVQSKEEARVAVALDYLGWRYIYQYPIAGGSRLRGGQVIDFLVFHRPTPRPLLVNGSYWHNPLRGAEDAYKAAKIRSMTSGRWGSPVVVWDYELRDIRQAIDVLSGRLGRA